MRRIILLLFFLTILTSIAFTRELKFDSDGNLIDKHLDKVYKLTIKKGVVFTSKFQGFSIENTLDTNRFGLSYGIGFTLREKFIYADVLKSIYKNILFGGFGYGYSFNHHQPYFCVILNTILF